MLFIFILTYLAFIALTGLLIYLIAPEVAEWLRVRRVVRSSDLAQQERVRQATQELSLMAWTARRRLRDIAQESRPQRPPRPRHTSYTRYVK